MPTDSNDNSTSTTVIIPSMNTSTETSNTNGLLSSSHSPLQSSTKQLNKLKRFLSTLYHFGSDISNEIGEHVRALILALVNNALSVEEFHGKVQTATNFPLRPFALPFLKSTLPHLQKDLSQLAYQSKQTTSQFIAQHEELIILPRDILDRSTSPSKEPINENRKRKSSDDLHEIDERPYTIKRSLVNHHRPLVSSSIIPSTSIRPDKERAFTAYLREYRSNTNDEWKNAENMFNYILEMVTKAKRILFLLQQKDHHLHRLMETNDLEWRRRHTDLLTQTEDRIVEIRRKTEETVREIKRQSIIDLQKAVSQTEQKSNEILLREREQYQRLKAQTFDEAYAVLNRQDDGPEHCWHCGRKAIETCSGCSIARYCGQFCQHRDWELHQKLCGPDFKRKLADNPQFYRYYLSKLKRTISPNQQNEISPIDITRRDSDATSTTPYLNVSSPSIVEETIRAKITTNDDENSDREKEITTVKSEDV